MCHDLPRSTYGSGYYAAPSFPDTPIYDSLVAERGTPQIAPIRVPAAYDTGNSYLPHAAVGASGAARRPVAAHRFLRLPAAGPAAAVPERRDAAGADDAARTAAARAGLYIPQQPSAPRGYQQPQQQQRPGTGYEAMRPASPRPACGARAVAVRGSVQPPVPEPGVLTGPATHCQ